MPINKETKVEVNLYGLIGAVIVVVATVIGASWAILSKIDTQTAFLNNQVLDLQRAARDNAKEIGAKANSSEVLILLAKNQTGGKK